RRSLRGGGTGRRGSGFQVQAEAGAATTEASATAEVAAPGLGLLSLQESGSDAERDAAARRRAGDILEALNGLQIDLLAGGTGDPARLARLAALESGEDGADPGLRAVVQAVVLRAKIELERRNRGSATTLS
ncbi:MAG: hypothetical protein EON47_22215, partial [Acetobacteraceae bacterium]